MIHISAAFLGSQSKVLAVGQSLSPFRLFTTPWTVARQASLSFIISWSLLKFMSIELVMPSNHLILCCHLPLLRSIFPSIRVFSNESVLCIRWPKYWSLSFSINPSNEYSGLISFRMDWFDLLAVQETLKSLLQHHSSKASVLLHSAFFIVQFSHPYMMTGKNIALTRWTFVGKEMSLQHIKIGRIYPITSFHGLSFPFPYLLTTCPNKGRIFSVHPGKPWQTIQCCQHSAEWFLNKKTIFAFFNHWDFKAGCYFSKLLLLLYLQVIWKLHPIIWQIILLKNHSLRTMK